MNLFVDIQRDVPLDAITDAQFTHWADCALQQGAQHDDQAETEICIRIVSCDESQQLNHAFRGKNKPTNVLSFPFEAPPEVPMSLLGDLAICADVVAQEATEQAKKLEHHWAHMTIHGILHLLGYDHINDTDAQTMEALEVTILASLDIPNPYEYGA